MDHAATFIPHRQKADKAYVPSFGFDGGRLTERHGAIHGDVASVEGWLEPEDALKLYELGYLASGPFLEVGTYRGKSAVVLTTALRDSGREVEFYTLDIARESLDSARETLATRGLGRYVTLVHGSVTAFFRCFPRFEPRFVFLDGDHSEEGLGRDLASLESRVPVGGLLLFHDFINPRNDDPADDEYGVPQAIGSSWVGRDCEFAGAFGCTGLYHRVRRPAEAAPGQAPELIELLALDRASIRFRIRVARPARRFVKRALARARLRGAPGA